jgi:AcrR family transcriptional regulator
MNSSENRQKTGAKSISAAKRTAKTPASRARAPRMNPADRENMIIARAIEHFSQDGFSAGTRELARKIGVTQSLLYRYFPTKEALIEKVYERVYLARWNPLWNILLKDRSLPIDVRMKKFYLDYSKAMVQAQWVRILIFAGLKHAGINERLFALLREQIYKVIVVEVREAFSLPPPRTKDDEEIELELVWGLHASIFYLGMRRWVYRSNVPENIETLIEALVEGLIESLKHRAFSAGGI